MEVNTSKPVSDSGKSPVANAVVDKYGKRAIGGSASAKKPRTFYCSGDYSAARVQAQQPVVKEATLASRSAELKK